MTMHLETKLVWNVIEKNLFAVLGMVNSKAESRTVGIVYQIMDRKLYIGTSFQSWKTRHISANPAVSMTIPIAKRIPVAPWVNIPQATITFSGTARIFPAEGADPQLLRMVFMHYAKDPDFMKENCLIEVIPQGEFLTYGIGIPLIQMRHPHKARGRAPVSIED